MHIGPSESIDVENERCVDSKNLRSIIPPFLVIDMVAIGGALRQALAGAAVSPSHHSHLKLGLAKRNLNFFSTASLRYQCRLKNSVRLIVGDIGFTS